jgi:hypothetical protein
MHPRNDHAPFKVPTDHGPVGFWPFTWTESGAPDSRISFHGEWYAAHFHDAIPEECAIGFDQAAFRFKDNESFTFNRLALRSFLEFAVKELDQLASLSFAPISDTMVGRFGEKWRPKQLEISELLLVGGMWIYNAPPRLMKIKATYWEGDESDGLSSEGNYDFDAFFDVVSIETGYEIHLVDTVING